MKAPHLPVDKLLQYIFHYRVYRNLLQLMAPLKSFTNDFCLEKYGNSRKTFPQQGVVQFRVNFEPYHKIIIWENILAFKCCQQCGVVGNVVGSLKINAPL